MASKINQSFVREAEILEEITAWKGGISTPLGLLLRKKVYEILGHTFKKLSEELSPIADNNIDVKNILIKHNLYTATQGNISKQTKKKEVIPNEAAA